MNHVSSSLHSFWTVHGREPERETSDSISRLLYSNSLAFDFSEPQLQAESRNLTSTYSMLDTSLDDRPPPRKMQRIFQDLKDLPVLREAVLKDFPHEAIQSLKSAYNPAAVDEEVSSGWQFFLQENTESR